MIAREGAVVLVDPASVPFLAGSGSRFRRRSDRRARSVWSTRTRPRPAVAGPAFRSESRGRVRPIYVAARAKRGRIAAIARAASRFNRAMPLMRHRTCTADDNGYSRISRRCTRPRFASSFALLKVRGRREDRVLAAPAVSCAICANRTRTRAYRFSGNTPAFPAQWLYGLLRALPGERLFLPPSLREKLASSRLDASTAASGPHDFAVRLSHTRQSQLSRPSHLTARS